MSRVGLDAGQDRIKEQDFHVEARVKREGKGSTCCEGCDSNAGQAAETVGCASPGGLLRSSSGLSSCSADGSPSSEWPRAVWQRGWGGGVEREGFTCGTTGNEVHSEMKGYAMQPICYPAM